MDILTVHANGIDIAYETFGDPADERGAGACLHAIPLLRRREKTFLLQTSAGRVAASQI